MLDSHAGGPGSIPDVGDNAMKAVAASLYRAAAGSEEGKRSEVNSVVIVVVFVVSAKTRSRRGSRGVVQGRRHGSPNARSEPRTFFVTLIIL